MKTDYRIQRVMDTLSETGIFDVPDESIIQQSERDIAQEPWTYEPIACTDDDLRQHAKEMRRLKADKRPSLGTSSTEYSGGYNRLSYAAMTFVDSIEVDGLGLDVLEESASSGVLSGESEDVDPIVHTVLKNTNIYGNDEQEMAVRIVSEHLLQKNQEQLLMYIAGVGGTGKSHVIRAIVDVFRRHGSADKILLGAPTGIASVLIGGYTIHALTCLPKKDFAKNPEVLQQIWKDVRYLIIDEISMIGAVLLALISRQIASAKGWIPGMPDVPFGGINVIFLGDFGQLVPVREQSVFSHKLDKKISSNQGQSVRGQLALHGVNLWRQVQTVVELKKNWRQADDPFYAALVSRIRLGNGTGNSNNHDRSDHDVLTDRFLNVIQGKDPRQLERFKGCPIVVSDKQMRDAINWKLVHSRARAVNKPVAYYVARDRCARKSVEPMLARRLRCLRSSMTADKPGILPVFVGMKVMITENLDSTHKIVNGSEGTVVHVAWDVIHSGTGDRFAKCVYVRVDDSGIHLPGLPRDVVPIFPTIRYFEYKTPGKTFKISRTQIPVIPAYAYTDYKSQGRSLSAAIVDIAGCKSLQSLYVMLSRVKTLDGLAVLRWFPPGKITQRLTHEFRSEFDRIDRLARATRESFAASHSKLGGQRDDITVPMDEDHYYI